MNNENNAQQRTERAVSRERVALERVLGYLWDEEAADYEALPPDGRRGHIFEEMLCLNDWLRRAGALQAAGCRVVVLPGEGAAV
ncbi:MAG: hypothetical protein IT450_01405 [Phycisphaerales bacterium]|nr:hypothetical protein [Phycisphaerales bacterium]